MGNETLTYNSEFIAMEVKTDREYLIKLDGKMDAFSENLERIASSLERLETIKFEGHEARISSLEKFQSKWTGVLLAFNITMAILAVLIAYYKH